MANVNHTGEVAIKRPVLRHKMYKAGKSWMVAGVVGLATAGTMFMTSGQAHADTTTASTGSSTATSATGSTSTSSFTQVNVDSSGVTSAASAASHAGAKVTQTSGTTYNVQGSAQLNSATSAVASDYASETSALNSAAVEAQNSNANSSAVAAINNQMSAITSSAQAAGVTVNQGSTVTVGSTGMTSAQAQAQIQSAQSSASAAIASATAAVDSAKAVTSATNAVASNARSEAASAAATGVTVNSATKAVTSVDEAKAIDSANKSNAASAVATVTSNNAAQNSANALLSNAASAAKAAGVAVKVGSAVSYNSVAEAESAAAAQAKELQNATAKAGNTSGTINANDIIQQLQIGNEDHATLTVSDVTGATVNKANKLFWGDLSTYAYSFVPSEKQGTITVTATYTGLTKSYYTDANGVKHQISKIVKTFKWDGSTTPAQTTGTVDGVRGVTFFVNNQPQEGFGYYGGTVTETDQFYDQNGNLITIGPNAYISVSSLNSSTNGSDVTTGTVLGGGWSVKDSRVEGAKGAGNVVLMPIQGSSVRLDSKTGWLNAPEGNDGILVGFGSNTGKYSYVGNGGKTLYSLSLNGSGNWVVGNAILQGTGDNGNVTSGDIWGAGYGYWDGSNGSAGNTQYFGAVAGKIDPGSTSFTVAFYTNGELLNSGNYYGTWAMVSTTIPDSQTFTYNPVEIKNDVATTITTPTYNPGTTAITVNKYVTGTSNTPTATYHLDTINYTTTGQKNVTDTQNGAATNIDGDYVTKGDKVQYTGTMADLPANRTNDITNVTFIDAVPAGVTVNSVKVYSAKGEDISNIYDITTTTDADGNHVVKAVGTDTGMLTAMNLDKTSSYKMPYIVITGTVNADNATLDNKILIKINGSSVATNTVENKTPNPTPSKSETTNSGTEDTNGKIVQKGDTINYKIDLDYSQLTTATAISDDQKAKGLSMTDNYDSKTTAVQNSLTVKDASGNTIPDSYYTATWDAADHKLTLNWNNVNDFIKTYGGQKLVVSFNATVNQDVTNAATIKNGAIQTDFGQNYDTNVVTNTIDVPNPTKSETTNGGTEDTNGKLVQKGDTINYTVNWDLSDVTASNTSKADQAKEWSLSDNYDAKTTAVQSSLVVYTAKGEVVPTSYYTATWDATNHSFTIKINDPASFLAKYGDQVLKAKFNATVNQDVQDAAQIDNTAYQTDAGHKYTTNTVTNTIDVPDPQKNVTENSGTTSADGSIVQKGDTLNYSWTWDLTGVSANNTSKAQQTLAWNTYDTYDSKTTADQSTIWVKDASGNAVDASYYTVTWDAANHKVTVAVKDPASFLAKYGNQKLTVGFDATVNADGINSGDEIKNTAYQTDAGHVYQTNTVINHFDNPTPTKSETVDGNTEDGNGKTVLKGDTINYKVTWDLSSDTTATVNADQIAKGMSLDDTYDSKTTADQSSLIVTYASGNTIPTSAYTVTWDATNHKVTITPTSISDFLKSYGGQTLTVKFNAKVNEDVKDGDEIKNTAYQNEFGHTYATDTVTNKVKVPDPKKDVAISVDNTKSLNGSTIQLNQEFDYALEGGEVPQGYAGKLTEYGFSDDYDQVHDQYNGQYTVLATQDIYLTDGTVIKKGTDLAQYAVQNIDQTNGKVTIEFSKDFLSKIDFTKGGFSATVYLAMKRIKAGTVYNTYDNTINNVVYKSNTVDTNTPEPKKPTTPSTPQTPSTPSTPQTPSTPASVTTVATTTPATPAQQQSQLPQTGNDANLEELLGLAVIGLTGMMALGLRKKRYGEK